jgi:hypothetical protein
MARYFKPEKAISRKSDTRDIREILIVCEGTRTEPNYFKAFPAKPQVWDNIDVKGKGYNTISLVREAIRMRKNALKEGRQYRQIWCVFDKDSFSDENFNGAIQLAQTQRIRCAFSNEAFEIWYLLHFDYFTSGLSRTQYAEKLSSRIGRPYEKNAEDMYQLLFDKQPIAIQNAQRLFITQMRTGRPAAKLNPITTVFHLVEILNGDEE